MSTIINWSVTAMDCYTKEGNETNVVFNVHWTCSGVFADTYGSVYATCSVPSPTGTFTPYADLTQDQVLGWIWANGVDKAATEIAVDEQIKQQIAPTVQTPPLPWG
jgi:hypothetical protein